MVDQDLSTSAPRNEGTKPERSKLMIAAAVICAVSVACMAFLVLTGVAPLTSGESFTFHAGEFTGMLLPIFAFASLVAALAAGIGRMIRGKSVSLATALWWGFLAAVGYTAFLSIGVHAQREMEKVQYQPLGCAFEVTFPRAPEIKLISVGELKFEQANVYTNDAVLRAECVPLGEPEAASKVSVRQWMENHAAQQGLAVEHIRVDQLSTGIFGYLVGKKIVSGNRAKYELRVQAGRDSLLVLMAGSLASAFPPAEAKPFFSSVK